ncbi:DcrB-related protein [Atlantibacter subterraneus]|uniref:DcrB-related protein n=1 Tax=Atlantibacter subterraneus TaxID=255519 RepID=UPI0028A1D375|nr:DcrB-related protein [Atlantibacter subterranea]
MMPAYHFNEGQLTLPASARDCTTHILRLPELQAVLTVSRDILSGTMTLEDYVAAQIGKIKRDARRVQILEQQFTDMQAGKRLCQLHCRAEVAGQVHHQQQHIVQSGQALLAFAWTLGHPFTEQDQQTWRHIVDSFVPREISVE